MAKGFWVKVKPQADFYGTATWKAVSNIWVKTTATSWQSVSDMWVKVKPQGDFYGTATWKALYSAGTAPDTPIQLLTSYNSTELLRLQGRNYHWSPTPTTLQYKFVTVDAQDNETNDITTWTTTTNPSSGSSAVLPTASTYVTIAKDASYIYAGTTNRIQFVVKGTTSSGLTFTFKDEYSLTLPKAPTVTATAISSTQVRLNITRNSSDAAGVANRYIVYLWDGTEYRYAGNTVGITGLGGYGVSETGNEITIGGLSPSIQYSFIVTPITGSAGSTLTNYYGYAGLEGTADSETISPYTFTFGKVLHVGTNGYIGLDAGATSDSILSAGTGRFLGIFPGDLYQLSGTSLWYWSNTDQFIVRWEGHVYGQPSQTRAYQVTFYKNQSYCTVYVLDATGGSTGTQAMVKDNTLQTSYPSNPATGSSYNVYFNGTTTPVTYLGASEKSKGVMVQVTALTSGTLDQGYTSITTSTNQSVTPTLGAFDISSFTKGLVYSSAQGASRSTTLSWGASTNAAYYQVQYQGSNDNTNWTTVRAYSSTYNISETTDTKNWSTSGGDFGYYTFMRANVRAIDESGSATYVYSNSGSYVQASGTAPGNPAFGTIAKSATTASIPFTVGTQGTNYLYSSIEYMYRTSAGTYPSTWSTSVITNGAGTISLSSLSSSTDYYIKIRTKNYDELYSSEVETTFQTTSALSITSVTYNGSGTITVNVSGGGPYYQIYWTTISNPTIGASYDAASTTTSISDTLTPTTTFDYYFWARSSTQNLGNTTQSGTATAGTYGDWVGPYTVRHITYNFNGGSNTTYAVFVGDGTTVTLPTPTSRTGYTFDGWYTATTGGTYIGTSGGSYTASSTLTLYARWTADTYTISYNANGGTGAPSDQTKTYGVDLTLSSTKPTRTNYGFIKWNTNSSGTGTDYNSGGTYTANAGATLYAQWGSLYTITFNSQSGTAVSAIQQSTVGGSIAKPTDPTRTDYTFGGWATSSTGTTAVTWPRTPSADETLYAIWTAAATVPGAVRNLSSSAITGGARITWDAPTSDGGAAITKYQIKRDTFAYFDNSPATATSYDYTLSAGTYTIYVRAVNSAGNGPETSTSVTIAAPFVQPQFNGTYPKFSTASPSNFQRVTSGTANFRWGWGNGTFSFSGSVDTSLNKGWNWHFGSTQLSAGTARTATSYKSFTTTNDTRVTVNSNYYPNLVWSAGTSPEVTYNANPRYLSIQAFCFGTDGNEYNGSWTGGI